MIGIGIIGCGKIAQVRHIPEYLENGQARLLGFYDLNRDRAQKLADTYRGKAYDSYEELLQNPDIRAVSVCAANSAHAAITIDALRAGKHVLCEKPMATTLEDCEAMVEAAKVAGRVLMIGQNQRLTRAHQMARQMVEDGVIGEILSFRTTFGHGGPETWSIDAGASTWFFDPKQAVMGAMVDLGIHKTDLLQYLTGQPIVETTAKMVTIDKKDPSGNLIGVDDNAICIYRLKNGAVGTMTASWTFYGREDNSTVLYGTKGILRIYDDPKYALVLERPDGSRVLCETEAMQTNDHQTSSGVIDAFVKEVMGEDENVMFGEDVLGAMRVVFASQESAVSGKTVVIGGVQ